METLVLEAVDFRDAAHWSWRLTTEGGAFIADHEVALDTGAVEYQGFVDLHGFLRQWADPGKRLASESDLMDRVGRWLGKRALGPIGPALVARSPATVRVRVPAGAEALLLLPFELTHVDGRPLALQDVSLVFEPAAAVAEDRAAVGKRLRMLAVFSVPTGVSALALRRERLKLVTLSSCSSPRPVRSRFWGAFSYGYPDRGQPSMPARVESCLPVPRVPGHQPGQRRRREAAHPLDDGLPPHLSVHPRDSARIRMTKGGGGDMVASNST